MTEPLLQLTGLRKRFPIDRRSWLPGRHKRSWLHAVDGVDLTIGAGESVGLVGESGCGKSTLARLITRLIAADDGEIHFAGERIDTIPPDRFARSAFRRQIQMVFQDPTESLNPRFSVFDAIADPARQLLPGLGAAGIRRAVEQAAAQVDLSSALFDRLPHQLSGGQKARVGIARAMVVGPRLLVLDEPTSALDVSVQAVVLQLLSRLRREAGVALLFVSHDLNVVRLLCERLLVMYLGQVVETGPAAQVFRDPRHPYTAALISAIQRLPGQPAGRIAHLPGELGSPIDPDPQACRLAGRCPVQGGICTTAPPPLVALDAHRAARCHFPLPATTP